LEHLNKLRSRAQRMERLLDDLLTYSRIGRRDGAVEQVKIETLLQDVTYVLSPPPGFTLIIEGELPTLLTPRTPLELVFRNLIGNAIKHHHRPALGEVRIRAQEEGDYIRFAVTDNGPGIEPQYFERIFGMFQVLKPRDEVEGSGMGLAIVKKTVEYRGGYIRLEANEGVGVTVYFTWPKEIN
jgi:signal transduction histidine kinase